MSQDLLEYIVQRVEKIDQKVDSLLQFKWQIISGSVVLSVVATFLIQTFIFFYEKGVAFAN